MTWYLKNEERARTDGIALMTSMMRSFTNDFVGYEGMKACLTDNLELVELIDVKNRLVQKIARTETAVGEYGEQK